MPERLLRDVCGHSRREAAEGADGQAVARWWCATPRANVFAVTAPGRLYRSLAAARQAHQADGAAAESPLERLLEPRERRAPAVTVADAHSHALAFVGSALGGRTIPLGLDRFGESGGRADLYRKMGIDADAIPQAAEAALLELDSCA